MIKHLGVIDFNDTGNLFSNEGNKLQITLICSALALASHTYMDLTENV